MTCSSAQVKISRDAALAATFSLGSGGSVLAPHPNRLRVQSASSASTPAAMTPTTPQMPEVVTGLSASSMAVSTHVSQPICWTASQHESADRAVAVALICTPMSKNVNRSMIADIWQPPPAIASQTGVFIGHC